MLQALHRFPILLTLYAGFGVLVHDTQLDSATLAAIKNPIYGDQAKVSSDGLSNLTARTPHVHAEGVSIKESVRNSRTQQPAIHPRNEAEKKVVAQRRSSGNDLGHDSIWPV